MRCSKNVETSIFTPLMPIILVDKAITIIEAAFFIVFAVRFYQSRVRLYILLSICLFRTPFVDDSRM
jgi:hypothetical protein